MEKLPWTRNEKIAFITLIVTIIGIVLGLIVKINLEINTIQDEIEKIKIKEAEIDTLKTDIAYINQLLANSGTFGGVQTKPCPEGYNPGISFGSSGTYTGCLPAS